MQGSLCKLGMPCSCTDDWSLVATTCEFLAFSFRYPNDESVEAIASGDWADALCELRGAWGLSPDPEAEILARFASEHEPGALLRTMRQEATRLFIGPPLPLVSPYESVWLASRTHTAPLLFVSPSAVAVEKFCFACGLGRPQGTNESLDHIASELELLQYLASIEARVIDSSSCNVLPSQFPGGSAAEAFALFLVEHVEKWVGAFALDLERTTDLAVYRAAARLLRELASVG